MISENRKNSFSGVWKIQKINKNQLFDALKT
jgi:hypothetical protein